MYEQPSRPTQPNRYRLRHVAAAALLPSMLGAAALVALDRGHTLQLEEVALAAYADGHRTGALTATESLTSSPSLTRTCFAWWFQASPTEVTERRARFCETQCSLTTGAAK